MDVIWIFITAFFTVVQGASEDPLCFKQDFAFGVATAAYQIEGAWNVSGKGESIWDYYTHSHPERVFDHSSGDVADDSYHRYKEDVRLLADLGVTFYRFSISWPRILPGGMSNNINPDGVKYYNDLLDELERYNISPVVTMYHWDLPQSLEDLGGWTNPAIADYFVDYAKVLFDSFGDRVPLWLTFNEPTEICGAGYGGSKAPGLRASGVADYMCAHNVIIAHARTFHLYKQEYSNQRGFLGITLCIAWMEPNSTSEADKDAAETANQFLYGWFAHPIFSEEGDYPLVMRQRVATISREQGFPRSRLPTFTREQVEMIKGSFDFMGVNHYSTHMASPDKGRPSKQPSFDGDLGVKLTQKDEWPKSNSTWLRVVPWGFRKALNWIRTTYNNPVMIITENGVSTEPGLHDTKRVQYLSSYLKSLHDAIEDGCSVMGYICWSLMDNFEWMRGFSERFGLYEVDFASPNKTRTPRLSAKFFAKLAKTSCIPEDYEYLKQYSVTAV